MFDIFGFAKIKAELESLESKVSVDLRADILTLGARVKTLESSFEARVKVLEDAIAKKV